MCSGQGCHLLALCCFSYNCWGMSQYWSSLRQNSSVLMMFWVTTLTPMWSSSNTWWASHDEAQVWQALLFLQIRMELSFKNQSASIKYRIPLQQVKKLIKVSKSANSSLGLCIWEVCKTSSRFRVAYWLAQQVAPHVIAVFIVNYNL